MDLEQSTGSVTVEYADPSGIYPSLAHELCHRLPLRHLHWKSSSRPVRTIDLVQITLVADKETLQSKDDGPGPKGESAQRERRHQIPGLRETPYLKIYLLHCSDVDSYRANSRKLLRDWVRNHTPTSHSSTSINKQENHDAFEWLIIHVLPQPTDGSSSRPLSGVRNESIAEKRPSSSRWPSRSSTSVIEKIRSDFIGTSRNAVDRVAQVLVDEHVVDDSQRGSQGEKNGWDDLMAKMKSLILASFDLRVNQYEEDIKEKELQRNLPGWNFNTFFVLKEGLARGFESVGLTEDALTGYHELAAGLNAILENEGSEGPAEQQTSRFSPYTGELSEIFKQAESSTKNAQSEQVIDLGSCILDTDRKPFRDLILANNISSFEFQCYIFARQVCLLLRLANVAIPKSAFANGSNLDGGSAATSVTTHYIKPTDSNHEDLAILAEVAQRATNFITSVAGTIRKDIRSSIIQPSASQNGNDISSVVIHDEIVGNIVASWMFSSSQCILEATSTDSLSVQLDPLLRQLRLSTSVGADTDGTEAATVISTVHRKDLPNRTCSLPEHTPIVSHSPSQENFPSITSLDAVRLLPHGTFHPGSQDLAAQRGDLLALGRQVLSGLGLRHGNWKDGLTDAFSTINDTENEMQDVNLAGKPQQETRSAESSKRASMRGPTTASTIAGVCNKTLLQALRSKSDYYTIYEILTASALANYLVGCKRKTAERMTVEIAITRFHLKDYSVAAPYFRQLAPFYGKSDWSDLESLMLDMYAQCLKHLDKIEEYIHIRLKMLAKIVQNTSFLNHQLQVTSTDPSEDHGHPRNIKVSFKNLVSASRLLKAQISAQMGKYFDSIDLGAYLLHLPDNDGFKLQLRLRSLLPEAFKAESVRVEIISIGEAHDSEVVLTAEGQVFEPGLASIWLWSNTMIPGWYVLSKVNIFAGNILFVHDNSSAPEEPVFAKLGEPRLFHQADLIERQRILLWPHNRSIDARLSHGQTVHLERPKSISLEIFSGWNQIANGRLSLRSGSAGLRLHTAGAEGSNDKVAITDKSQPGLIFFGQFPSDSVWSISVPFNCERDLKDMIVRIEINYTTAKGEFLYACSQKISTILPITINVQDIFKRGALFSKFTVGTAVAVPVRISRCQVEGNSEYEITSPSLSSASVDVFARQPLSRIAKIQHVSGSHQEPSERKPAHTKLALHVDYRCVDQEILTVIESVFFNPLAGTPLQRFSRLLRPTLLASVHAVFSTQELEVAELLREINIGAFDEYSWGSSIICGLPPDLGQELAKWLKRWHEDHRTILLQDGRESSALQRLTVPFEIPYMHVLQTAKMRPKHGLVGLHSKQLVLAIGSALPLELIISHTREWCNGNLRSQSITLDFMYEVYALPDDWIIGGQRKGVFSAKEGEDSSFTIILLPQRMGHIMFPSVDIRPASSVRMGEPILGQGSAAEAPISCETDYDNQSDTIQVVSDLSSTTVSIDPNVPDGRAWLVDSESR